MSRSPRTAVAKTGVPPPPPSYAELEARIAVLTAARDEALQRETAIAEILQVINSRPGDRTPVFEAILEKARILCGAAHGSLSLYDGERFRAVAINTRSQELADRMRQGFLPSDFPNLIPLLDGARLVHVPDLAEIGNPYGSRTGLFVPLRKDDALLGLISTVRLEIRPFSDKEIALVENFAAQAVIAMENARLLGELQARTRDLEESLEYQTATSDVLNVISRSTTDLQPVLDTVVETAARLCGADHGTIAIREGEVYRYVSASAADAEYWAALRERTIFPGRDTIAGRVALEGGVVHIADISADPDHAVPEAVATGVHTALGVPLLREGVVLGAITFGRKRVEPFTERQIELVRTFADQAVIAIENARLLKELQARTRDLEESLEYQTATSDVLNVISRSTADLQPVLDTVVETAVRLCGADDGSLRIREGEAYRYVAACEATTKNVEYWEALRQRTIVPGRGSISGRVALEGRVVHVADVRADPDYALPDVVASGLFTQLGVPLLRDGEVIGTINLSRKRVEPYTERQIELVRTFADQAVIAMENARLLGELQARTRDLEESLEYQTATSDVLNVISRLTSDVQPVLDTVAETAVRLCGADLAHIATRDGDVYRSIASFAMSPEVVQAAQNLSYTPGRGSVIGRALLACAPVQIADVTVDRDYAASVRAADKVRTVLGVPLMREGEPIGVIALLRERVEPYTERQIDLVRTFADQAVIAMENARLLGELQARTRDLEESLEYQTATSEVLKVISRSTFDLQPVLDTLAETAARLCDAGYGAIYRRDGEVYRIATAVAFSPETREAARKFRAFVEQHPLVPNRGSITGRVALERRAVHVADTASDPEYMLSEATTLGNLRTQLGVPLLREGEPIGVIALARQRVEPFTERQVELVQTFADQAVIAIENARLLGELRERTGDLQESLEYQTATSDVLKVISQSGAELEPMLETLVATAARICEADKAVLGHIRDGLYRMGASVGFTQEYKDYRTRNPITFDRGTAIGRMALERRVVHIEDASNDPEYTDVDARHLGQFRTVLSVPLIREDAVIGGIFLARSRVEPFSEKQIELVTTFADQAVIAIENARLLNELRDRTEEVMRREAELRVTFDNMADGVVMFDADMRLAAWNRNFQQILHLPDAVLAERLSYAGYFRNLAGRGEFGEIDVDAELRRYEGNVGRQWSSERTRPDGRVIEVRNNPVPGGGLVLIYSDITERKEAEARLRVARDAAEATLRELRAAQANLIHAEKMASLGQLTAGIAHEIKNPLNFVNNFAGLSVELLDELKEVAAPALVTLDDYKRAEIDETIDMLTGNLEKIAEHGRRADGIVKSMLAHSRGGGGEWREVDLNGLIEEALNLAYHGARAQDQNFNITLERDLDYALASIELVPQDMTRVFLNLFGNGFYAAAKRQRDGAAPEFRPALKVSTRDLGDGIEITVRDNGTGIPPEIRDKLFQPFFTTKPTGEGTGLGLSISWDIVTQQHGGTIAVDSQLGEFTEFTIRLPRSRQAATPVKPV